MFFTRDELKQKIKDYYALYPSGLVNWNGQILQSWEYHLLLDYGFISATAIIKNYPVLETQDRYGEQRIEDLSGDIETVKQRVLELEGKAGQARLGFTCEFYSHYKNVLKEVRAEIISSNKTFSGIINN